MQKILDKAKPAIEAEKNDIARDKIELDAMVKEEKGKENAESGNGESE